MGILDSLSNDLDEDEMEMLRERLESRKRAEGLMGDYSEAGDFGMRMALGGLDALSRMNNSNLGVAETLKGRKTSGASSSTNYLENYQKELKARASAARIKALAEVKPLEAFQKMIDSRREKEEKAARDAEAREAKRQAEMADDELRYNAMGFNVVEKDGKRSLEPIKGFKKPGAVEKPSQTAGGVSRDYLVPGVGEVLTKDDAKKLKDASAIRESFVRKADELINLRQKFGTEFFNRTAVERAKQLSNELLLDYKNMQSLGVLSKSDEGIINSIIPSDPLEMNVGTFGLGDDATLNRLQSFRDDTVADYNSNVRARIKPGAISLEAEGANEDDEALAWLHANPHSPDAPAVMEKLRSRGRISPSSSGLTAEEQAELAHLESLEKAGKLNGPKSGNRDAAIAEARRRGLIR